MKFLGWLLTCIGLLLSGCLVGPNYKRPDIKLPKHYIMQASHTTAQHGASPSNEHQILDYHHALPKDWWTLLQSKQLNDLVLQGFTHNPDIDALKANLQASLQEVYAQRAALYPFAGFYFNPARQQTARILTSVLSSNEFIYSLYTAQVAINYAPDLFGGTRRQIESLVAQAELQHYQLQALYTTLATNIANAAIQVAAIEDQIALTKRLIASQAQVVNILQQQITHGSASVLDLNYHQALLAHYQAGLAPLEQACAIQQDLLQALTGKYPDEDQHPKLHISSFSLPHRLPVSIPSSLLEHRPDIRAAEANMHAANALIGVAVSNRLPNLNFNTTDAGSAARNFASFLASNTNFWSLSGLISQPIFDAGKLKHKQGQAVAVYQQSTAIYKSTVIHAFQNVADTLHALATDEQAVLASEHEAQAAYANWQIAKQRYHYGSVNRLNRQSTEQLYYITALNVIQSKANRLSDSVALFQALGGGWWHNERSLPAASKQ